MCWKVWLHQRDWATHAEVWPTGAQKTQREDRAMMASISRILFLFTWKIWVYVVIRVKLCGRWVSIPDIETLYDNSRLYWTLLIHSCFNDVDLTSRSGSHGKFKLKVAFLSVFFSSDELQTLHDCYVHKWEHKHDIVSKAGIQGRQLTCFLASTKTHVSFFSDTFFLEGKIQIQTSLYWALSIHTSFSDLDLILCQGHSSIRNISWGSSPIEFNLWNIVTYLWKSAHIVCIEFPSAH